MSRKAFSGIMVLTLLLISTLTLAFNIQTVKSTWTGTVYIRADGSIDPPDAPIITYDNITYTLTDNITSSGDGIVVERDNIVIDGAGYTIQGTFVEYFKGISLIGRINVTVKNAQIQNFFYGVYLYHSSSNSISGNNITDNFWNGVTLGSSSNNSISGNNIKNSHECIRLDYSSNNSISRNNIIYSYCGIWLLHSSYNSIVENNIICNYYHGLFLSVSPSNFIYHNNFIDNKKHVGVWEAGANVWDDGYPSGGNFWDNYTGIDEFAGPNQDVPGSDGIGDTPYVISANNVDHYPLMNSRGPLSVFIKPLSASIPAGQSVKYTSAVSGGRPPYSYQWFLNESAVPNATLSSWVFTPETRGFYIVHLKVTDGLNNTAKSDDSKVIVKWVGTIYIRVDGSIDPPDAPISTHDNITYKLTDDIISYGDGIIVERSNIVINGGGHIVQGAGGTETKGIALTGRINVTIFNFTVTGFYFGVWLSSSCNNSVCENTLEGNSFGIMIYDSSDYNHIYKNRITGGNGAGIFAVYPWWGHPPKNNTIYQNYVADNAEGIMLFSSGNVIHSNNIIHNGYYAGLGYGIQLWGSDNKIYHNNFIDNAAGHVYSSKIPNIWDDGYPSGGNYWSDYTGVDYYSGPYQNETGSDGIGDAPYVIDENNIDHYPLMNPWGSGTPIASFTWTPSVPEVGEVVTFDASASMSVGGEIVSYEWDFGDGSRATGMIVTHVYSSAGTFTVTLNVTDSEGLWDVEQKQIEVKPAPQPLTVSISPLSASILLGESVTFTSTTSGGCPPYTYQWYLNGNPVSGATSDTWTFTPAAIGVYYVYVKVIDCKNDIAQSEIAYISVTSAPVVAPIAAFTWSPRSPLEGETVVFDASASRPDSGEIVRFVWSFGDGESGEGKFVTHTYSRSGLYKVTLTVFSSEGLSDSVSDYIFVRPKCFILTAVLGTDAEGDLNYLRLFRDRILRTNPVGEAFVTFYYEASPPIADQLSRNQLLRVLTAILFVQPLIITVKILLSPYSIALYAALAALFFYAVKKRKLKALLTFIQVSAITATAISLTALTLGLIAKTIPQASIIASIMLPTIIPTAIITATIKTFKKQRKKPTISSANL